MRRFQYSNTYSSCIHLVLHSVLTHLNYAVFIVLILLNINHRFISKAEIVHTNI